jgi:two-component system chemotaxis response regulator CheB
MALLVLPWFVAIGASGEQGLHDVIDLLSALPSTPASVLMVVLHRPSNQTSQLLTVLQRQCAFPVAVAAQAQCLEPGHCYIGEPAEHLTLMSRGRACLVNGEGHTFRNRTVDLLFESIARIAGRKAIGIIVSGALSDGSKGLAAIHHAGGITMVLAPGDKERGMQQNAIDFDGPVSMVGSSSQLSNEITRLTSQHESVK